MGVGHYATTKTSTHVSYLQFRKFRPRILFRLVQLRLLSILVGKSAEPFDGSFIATLYSLWHTLADEKWLG